MGKREIKAIIFDLDGTLYEDTGHFNYYAERLKERLEPPYQQNFELDYQKVPENKHPLKIGRIYDVQQDLILLQEKKVQAAFRWDGTPLTPGELDSLYPGPVSLNMESMISIGDLWWVPCAIALHYGLDNQESYQAFLETRDYMKQPGYTIKPVEGLKEVLNRFRKKGLKLVLMTNSPEPDSEAILAKLELNKAFDLKIFNAGKPAKAKEQFKRIIKELNLPCSQILSIGDNLANEILPARELGCPTLFIDHHDTVQADRLIENLANCRELVKFLEGIIARDSDD